MAFGRILGIPISFLVLTLFFFINYAQTPSNSIYVLEVEGVIDSVVSGYVAKGINIAIEDDAEAIVIQMDTPGGLDISMRTIIKDVLESEVPVVVYVYPGGARAASAGSFILMAAHVTAMAPGTNVGAAHPVAIGVGGTADVSEKIVNDAAAYMKSIAEARGRDTEVAQSFVYNSTSITARDAMEKGIVDIVAGDYDALLEELDGYSVDVASGKKTIKTQGAVVKRLPMSASERFLHTISNPTVAYILFLAGMYGIIFELQNPGAILPGVLGGISMLLALWSFQALSVSATGIAFIIFAVILFIAELYTPTMGILAAGGIMSLILGSILLINAEKEPYVRISLSVIISTAFITALFFLFVVGLTVKTQRKKPTTGIEGMVGLKGETKTELDPEGSIFVHGETWHARATAGSISKGKKIKVVDVENLTLIVEEI
ncbi:MAG: nodulation protein NfeD [Candidatus Hydrothermarchaeales archaeon]